MNDNFDRHIVLGAGALGRATAKALLAKGEKVTLVNRSGTLADCPPGADLLAGDLTKPNALDRHLNDAAALYFCAQPLYHRWSEEFAALQDAAIRLAESSGVNLIVAENLYGYGPVHTPMTESMPMRPNTRKGAVRAEMHDALMAAHDDGRIKVAIARASDFFGPYVDGSAAGSRAFNAITAGKAVDYVGDLNAAHSYTFVEDFGTALAVLGTDDRSLGQVWHVPNSHAVTSRQFFERAFAIAGHKPKFRKISGFEMKALGLFIPPLREMAEMVYEFEEAFVVDDNKFKSTFGDISTPLDAALKQTIEWTVRPTPATPAGQKAPQKAQAA